jgi:hypothetical protein
VPPVRAPWPAPEPAPALRAPVEVRAIALPPPPVPVAITAPGRPRVERRVGDTEPLPPGWRRTAWQHQRRI